MHSHPTERDAELRALAERYHREAEAYDRTVCTGPIRGGSIMPATPREMRLVQVNANKLRELIVMEGVLNGFSRAEILRAMRHDVKRD